jgi:hypothetical protein
VVLLQALRRRLPPPPKANAAAAAAAAAAADAGSSANAPSGDGSSDGSSICQYLSQAEFVMQDELLKVRQCPRNMWEAWWCSLSDTHKSPSTTCQCFAIRVAIHSYMAL